MHNICKAVFIISLFNNKLLWEHYFYNIILNYMTFLSIHESRSFKEMIFKYLPAYSSRKFENYIFFIHFLSKHLKSFMISLNICKGCDFWHVINTTIKENSYITLFNVSQEIINTIAIWYQWLWFDIRHYLVKKYMNKHSFDRQFHHLFSIPVLQ